mgnify:CR=1 FL=1
MCGRFVVAKTVSQIKEIFEADDIIGVQPEISFNIAPTQTISMIVERPDERDQSGDPIGDIHREIHAARWGLVPRWSKGPDSGAPLFNARIETVAEKPSFKDSFLRRRAAVPASGYFEWQTASDGTKRPFYINAGDDGLFAFAAVYEWWLDETKVKDDPSRWLLSTAILTKDASGSIEHIHDRSPVFLSPESLDHWLNPAVIGDAALLSEISTDSVRVAEEILFHQVGSEVGSVRNNEPNLIRPIS